MKISTSAFALSLLIGVSPAVAWDNTINGRGPNQIVDGGAGAQATASARSQAAASASVRSTNANMNRNFASGGSASATGGNVSISGSGDRQSGGIYLTVPDGGGQAPCGGGIGIGGLGIGGGGSGGGTLWEFTDCKVIREAHELQALGRPDLALNLMCQQIDRVREAMGGSCSPPPPAPPMTVVSKPDWCYTASAGERLQHKECLAGHGQ